MPQTPSEPTTAATEVDLVHFTEEDEQCIAERASLKKYTDWNCKRKEERAKLEVEAEETWEFRVGESLRLEWASAQKRDPHCPRIFRDFKNFKTDAGRRSGALAKSERDVHRIAADGFLERRIN